MSERAEIERDRRRLESYKREVEREIEEKKRRAEQQIEENKRKENALLDRKRLLLRYINYQIIVLRNIF